MLYLDSDYKFDFSNEEFIENEIKLFVLTKHLRYFLHNETVLMKFDKLIPKSYEVYFDQIKNPNMIVNQVILVDF